MEFPKYSGMSYERASREAAALIAQANTSGRWMYDLPQRLSALREIMQSMSHGRPEVSHLVDTQSAIAQAFNEWMRRYTQEPEQFEREWQTVSEFLVQQGKGEEPDYGKSCAAYLAKLIDEVSPCSAS